MSESKEAGITKFGQALRLSGAARFYHNGDGVGFVWRWWHPLAWVMAPLAFVVSVLVDGVPETLRYRYEVGFGINPWFKAHPDELEWL